MRQLLYLVFFFLTLPLAAQPGTQTEISIQREADYIAAKREALLGKTDKAIELFKGLVEVEPDNDALQFELGRLQYANGDTDAAIDALKKAYDKRPSEVYAAFLAELFQASGRHAEGAELYAGLIKRNPGAEEFYLERAAFLVRAQDIKGAVEVYNQLEKRIGINAELTRLKHSLYLGQGDTKRAEKELLNLIAAQPNQLSHRHLLAGFYVSQDDKAKARKTYEEILRLEPADVRAQLALQDVRTEGPATAGNDDELLRLLGRTDVDIDLKIGKILPLVQQLARTQDAVQGQRAMALAAELRRVHPDEAKAAAIQGDLYFHTGQLAKAAEAYRTTLELDDTVYPVWEQLLGTLYLSNQITELRRYAEDALDVYPNRPAIYVNYALGEALRADFDAANGLLEQARLMVGGQPEAAAQFDAIGAAFAALQNGGGNADAQRLPGGQDGPLGFLIANGSNASQLKAKDAPENTNALFLEYLGDALKKSGDKAGAKAAYQRAKAAGSKSPTLRRKMLETGS